MIEQWRDELGEVSQQLTTIKGTMVYAFACGSRCSMGALHPREREVLEHVDQLERRRMELSALIAEHQVC